VILTMYRQNVLVKNAPFANTTLSIGCAIDIFSVK
jgi:hypothetical protein